jgi:hypothetical protein
MKTLIAAAIVLASALPASAASAPAVGTKCSNWGAKNGSLTCAQVDAKGKLAWVRLPGSGGATAPTTVTGKPDSSFRSGGGLVDLPAGPILVRFTADCSSSCELKAKTAKGEDAYSAPSIYERGNPIDAVMLVNYLDTDDPATRLQVNAKSWKVQLLPLSAATPAAVGQRIVGTSPAVLAVQGAPTAANVKAVARVSFVTYSADRQDRDYVIQEFKPFSGDVVVPAGTGYIWVDAVGSWEVTLR